MKTKFIILILGFYSQFILAQCWVSVKSNGFNTVGTTSSGDIKVWGANNYGQIGNGTTTPIGNIYDFGNQTVWKEVSISETSFGIKQNGTLWVWGSDALNPTSAQTLPIQMGFDTDWKKVSCRYSNANPIRSLAIKTNNTLWDLGNYPSGNIISQVGTDNDWKDVFTGNGFSFAIKNNGTLWSWGQNTNGQLGDGTTIDKTIPTQIGVDNNWKNISTSDLFVFGLKNDGTLWRWGAFYDIQYLNPIQVGTDNDWKDITTLNQAMLAIKDNGTLWGWGENWHGNFGNGTNTALTNLTQIGTDTNWLSISAGAGHVTALKTDNTLWVWGSVYNGGTLGNGTTTSNVPIQLSCSTLSIANEFEGTTNKFLIFPNPANDYLTIKNKKIEIFSYQIFDILGKLILSGKSKSNERIDIQTLEKGNYILKIETENGKKSTEKLIKN